MWSHDDRCGTPCHEGHKAASGLQPRSLSTPPSSKWLLPSSFMFVPITYIVFYLDDTFFPKRDPSGIRSHVVPHEPRQGGHCRGLHSPRNLPWIVGWRWKRAGYLGEGVVLKDKLHLRRDSVNCSGWVFGDWTPEAWGAARIWESRERGMLLFMRAYILFYFAWTLVLVCVLLFPLFTYQYWPVVRRWVGRRPSPTVLTSADCPQCSSETSGRQSSTVCPQCLKNGDTTHLACANSAALFSYVIRRNHGKCTVADLAAAVFMNAPVFGLVGLYYDVQMCNLKFHFTHTANIMSGPFHIVLS